MANLYIIWIVNLANQYNFEVAANRQKDALGWKVRSESAEEKL
jgi:hypothetical protein